jgi:ribonuclease HI
VVVHSDSMICVNVINGRGKKDTKRGNKDLVFRFREVARPHQVSAVFVRAHAGDRYNEACDAAATTAMRDKRDSYPAYCMPTKEQDSGLYQQEVPTEAAGSARPTTE